MLAHAGRLRNSPRVEVAPRPIFTQTRPFMVYETSRIFSPPGTTAIEIYDSIATVDTANRVSFSNVALTPHTDLVAYYKALGLPVAPNLTFLGFGTSALAFNGSITLPVIGAILDDTQTPASYQFIPNPNPQTDFAWEFNPTMGPNSIPTHYWFSLYGVWPVGTSVHFPIIVATTPAGRQFVYANVTSGASTGFQATTIGTTTIITANIRLIDAAQQYPNIVQSKYGYAYFDIFVTYGWRFYFYSPPPPVLDISITITAVLQQNRWVATNVSVVPSVPPNSVWNIPNNFPVPPLGSIPIAYGAILGTYIIDQLNSSATMEVFA
ncbi:hypothetical protein D6779_07930 [Candidatus Parcubacteria bacterium]|nr:MAG: hypothetical protein D6779_07930 [Candidatus Parcubacteria bacterium]